MGGHFRPSGWKKLLWGNGIWAEIWVTRKIPPCEDLEEECSRETEQLVEGSYGRNELGREGKRKAAMLLKQGERSKVRGKRVSTKRQRPDHWRPWGNLASFSSCFISSLLTGWGPFCIKASCNLAVFELLFFYFLKHISSLPTSL